MDLNLLRLKIFALAGWLFSWRSPAPRPKFNVLTATAKDLGTLLNKGVVTSEEIVSTYLNQIEKYNGYLHAVISTPPRDKVLAYARNLDQERKSGQVRGPMHGIPILVKVRSNAMYTEGSHLGGRLTTRQQKIGQHSNPSRPRHGHNGRHLCSGGLQGS